MSQESLVLLEENLFIKLFGPVAFFCREEEKWRYTILTACYIYLSLVFYLGFFILFVKKIVIIFIFLENYFLLTVRAMESSCFVHILAPSITSLFKIGFTFYYSLGFRKD